MKSLTVKPIPLPPRPITRPLPPEPEASPWGLRRVRRGRTYCWRSASDYDYDAAEARSGLPGHPA
jgi:hypothetical protein